MARRQLQTPSMIQKIDSSRVSHGRKVGEGVAECRRGQDLSVDDDGVLCLLLYY